MQTMENGSKDEIITSHPSSLGRSKQTVWYKNPYMHFNMVAFKFNEPS